MLTFLPKKRASKGLIGLATSDQGLAVARVSSLNHELRLEDCMLLAAEPHGRARALADAVSHYNLRGAACTYLLAPSDYNLLLVEAPKVRPDEMSGALIWRIKNLIDHSVDDVAIDYFHVPPGAYHSQGDMLYVVAARKLRLLEARDMVEEAGLDLEAIDIPELAMLNLSRLYGDDTNGLAFIDFRSDGTTLNLSKGGAIYLTRHLSTLLPQNIALAREWDSLCERLVVEIQRSLDYFESQMGQGQVDRLLLAPRPGGAELAAQLNHAMGVRVENLDLTRCFQAGLDLPAQLQHDCLLAAGGALRNQIDKERAAA